MTDDGAPTNVPDPLSFSKSGLVDQRHNQKLANSTTLNNYNGTLNLTLINNPNYY